MSTPYRSYTDRMQVTVPEGEVDGLVVQRFEVVAMDEWTPEDEARKDVLSLLELARMERDGRGCESGWYTRLLDMNEKDDRGRSKIWMSDTTAERRDHRGPVAHIQLSKAKRVLINGLGLGMVLHAALSYEHVEHVDVVESDERVIKLIGPHYQKDPRVNIIHADAYEQVEEWKNIRNPVVRWDVGWSDIWPTIDSSNLPSMDKLHAFYRNRCGWHGMWARHECLQLRRELRAYGLPYGLA